MAWKIAGLGWVGVAVDGGSADTESLGDFSDGGAVGRPPCAATPAGPSALASTPPFSLCCAAGSGGGCTIPWEGCSVSGTRFDRGVRRDAVARVAAGESASAVARDVGCRHETVSRWCREAGVVLVRGRRGGSFEADRARRAQVVLAVLGGAGLPGAAAVAGVCRQSASRYWHDQVMETATAASARSSARSSGRRCCHGPSGSACSGRVGRGRRLSDAERVLIAQGRARACQCFCVSGFGQRWGLIRSG